MQPHCINGPKVDAKTNYIAISIHTAINIVIIIITTRNIRIPTRIYYLVRVAFSKPVCKSPYSWNLSQHWYGCIKLNKFICIYKLSCWAIVNKLIPFFRLRVCIWWEKSLNRQLFDVWKTSQENDNILMWLFFSQFFYPRHSLLTISGWKISVNQSILTIEGKNFITYLVWMKTRL